MRGIKIGLCLLTVVTVVLAQYPDQNLLVTAGIQASVDVGDTLNRGVYFLRIPENHSADIYVRVFDADLGGQFDRTVGASETRFSIYGQEGIDWNIFSGRDTLPESPPLTRLTLGQDRFYDNQWRTIARLKPEQGELRDGYRDFQLIVDGITGKGQNIYQLFISQAEKENQPIEGSVISSPSLSIYLPGQRELATQITFSIPPTAKSLAISNYDADVARTRGKIYFETQFRADVPLAISDDAEIKTSQVQLSPSEPGKLGAIIIENNQSINNIQLWIETDSEERVFFYFPPTILPVNRLPQAAIELTPLSDCKSMLLDATESADPEGDELSFTWIFPDGHSETGGRIVHNFEQTGTYPLQLIVADNSGYIANAVRVDQAVTINAPPQADFSYSERGVPGEELRFDASLSTDSDGRITSYFWEFGDRRRERGEKVSHSYRRPGKYKVTLTAEDDGPAPCNRDKISKVIWINAAPVANINIEKDLAAIDEELSFNAKGSIDSDGEILNYAWDFGDGTAKEGEFVNHRYRHSGRFTVNLTVSDNAKVANSKVTEQVEITINEPPVAKVKFPAVVAANQSIFLSGAESYDPDGRIVAYQWELGDGNSKSGQKISHQYQKPGRYTVSLTVRDNTPTANNQAVLKTPIRVNFPSVPDAGGDRIVNSSQIEFDASNSQDADDEIIDYFWNFGDNSSAHGQKVTHVYAHPGRYQVILTTTDASGTITAKQSDTVSVKVNHPPLADAGRPQVVAINESLQLNGGFSRDSDGRIVSYTWDVLPGETLEGKKVTYQYDQPGLYQVELTVIDNDGAKDVHSTMVIVNSPPVPRFAPIGRIGPGETHWYDASRSYDIDGEITEIEWEFGDGSENRVGQKVAYAYPKSGNYTLTIKVKDDSPARNSITMLSKNIMVNHAPNPVITTAELTCDQNIFFDASQSSDADKDQLTYHWDYGDGNTATGIKMYHNYLSPGIYPVVLRIDDGQGRSNSVQRTSLKVQVNSPPQAVAAVNKDTICAGEPLMFDGSNSLDNENDLLRYSWDFGDGDSAQIVNPVHAYKLGGDYRARLVVYDDTNLPCNASDDALLIHVIDAPVAEAGADQSVCANSVVQFDGSESSGGGRLIKSYEWDFGDGEMGGGINPTHVYTEAGIYTVRLTITVPEIGNCENTSSDELIVKVISAPTARLSAPEKGCVDVPLFFDGRASHGGNSNIIAYIWDFGDGTTARGDSVYHAYEAPGRYPIKLTVKTDSELGCDLAEMDHMVAINTVPEAEIELFSKDQDPQTVDEYTVYLNDLVHLKAVKSQDKDGYIAAYQWDFGDGEQARGMSVRHHYQAVGVYPVKLVVTDNSHTQCNQAENSVQIQAIARDTIAITAPTIAFVNEPVTFELLSAQKRGQTVEWIFSDGTRDTGATVEKSFASAGTYMAQARQENIWSEAAEIDIHDFPKVKMPTPKVLDLGQGVSLEPLIHNPLQIPIATRWDFGDGATEDGLVVEHQYAASGDYTAQFFMWYRSIGNGEPQIYTVPVKIIAPPQVSINISPETIYSSGGRDEVFFSATVDQYQGKLRFTWDFGDGISAHGRQVKHNYQQPGQYTVTLYVKDALRKAGKEYRFTKEIKVQKR